MPQKFQTETLPTRDTVDSWEENVKGKRGYRDTDRDGDRGKYGY